MQNVMEGDGTMQINGAERAALTEVNREASRVQEATDSTVVTAEQRWESDPSVWQNLDEETPYGDPSPDRMGQYADPDALTEVPTVAEAMLQMPRYAAATPLFGRYLRAMVLTRHAQMAPDRVDPFVKEDFEALTPRGQVEQGQKLQALAQEVFDWMRQQGMDPMPGHESLPELMTPELIEALLAQDR